MPNTRLPAVAGAFYPADASTLRERIEWCFRHRYGPGRRGASKAPIRQPIAFIVPHAGYRFSGPTAAHAYSKLAARRRPDAIFVIGPNHRMIGAPIALSDCDAWETPLGSSPVHPELTSAVLNTYSAAKVDDLAHRYEHSIEVQLPFIQFSAGQEVPIVPIILHAQDFVTSRDLGLALADVARGSDAVIIASSDFTHYESHFEALRLDRYALDAIEALDVQGFAKAVLEHDLSVCGPGAIVTAMVAAMGLGSTSASILHHGTSGELSDDFDRVVAYAAIALE